MPRIDKKTEDLIFKHLFTERDLELELKSIMAPKVEVFIASDGIELEVIDDDGSGEL